MDEDDNLKDGDIGDEGKPVLHLVGIDSNAFVIMGAAVKAARRAKWGAEKLTELRAEMMSGDYDHVLQTCMKHFDVR